MKPSLHSVRPSFGSGPSIGSRVTLLVILATLFTGILAGLSGAWAARAVVGHRFAEDAAGNAARMVEELHLPQSTRLARTLGGVYGGEAVFTTVEGELMACSLDTQEEQEFRAFLAISTRPRDVSLDGVFYHVSSCRLRDGGDASVFWLLVPDAVLRRAQWQVLVPFLAVSLLATVVTASFAGRLTRALVRPLQQVGDELHQLAGQLRKGEWNRTEFASSETLCSNAKHPREVARLAEAFQGLVVDLHWAQERLAESSRLAAVGKLAASVAHELRNPLTGIRMNAQVLAQALAREGREDPSLDLIVKETDRLSLRLEELLGVATGSRTAKPADAALPVVSLETVRDGVVALVRTQFHHAGVTLNCLGDFDVKVQAQADDLRRILLNLLLNALDVSQSGDTVELRCDRTETHVHLVVADQGGGIDPGVGDVFAPFATSKPDGVGLGLSISRELATRNGGELACRNFAMGAKFTLSLPRVTRTDANEPEAVP